MDLEENERQFEIYKHQMKEIEERFPPLDKWVLGECSICGNKCNEGYFFHEACCITYEDLKKAAIRAWLQSGQADRIANYKKKADEKPQDILKKEFKEVSK